MFLHLIYAALHIMAILVGLTAFFAHEWTVFVGSMTCAYLTALQQIKTIEDRQNDERLATLEQKLLETQRERDDLRAENLWLKHQYRPKLRETAI